MKQPIKYIVFTDASCRRSNSSLYCGYGGVILNTDTNRYASYGGSLGERSTVYCEAWGLLRGLIEISNVIKSSKGKEPVGVLLVTDSKLNVQILTEWIPKWDLSDWMNWRKRDGSLVKNQDLYRRILRVIQDTPEMKVRITHVNSHLTDKEWRRIFKKLQDYGINADESTSKTFMRMNALADGIATNITSHLKDTDTGWFKLVRRDADDA